MKDKQMLKKFIAIIIILMMVTGLYNGVNAAETKTKLIEVENGNDKYIMDAQGNISRRIISLDSNNGEVTIELKIQNNKKESQESLPPEIFFVIDTSRKYGVCN